MPRGGGLSEHPRDGIAVYRDSTVAAAWLAERREEGDDVAWVGTQLLEAWQQA